MVPYFSKLLNGPFVESKADHVNLNEEIEDPIAVELFCHWLYRGSLPDIPEDFVQEDFPDEESKGSAILAAETPYHHLYYMAEKWCMTSLKNQTMDSIRHFHRKIGRWVHHELIVEGFQHTPTNSPLRRYLTESAACSCLLVGPGPHILDFFTETIGLQSQDIWPAILGVIRNMVLGNDIVLDDPDIKDDEDFHDPVSQI
ncbi:hypothetical protein MMC17_003265 [Xylographa soralifera]|nr:hypothetical protein [Xylographa soralifera]